MQERMDEHQDMEIQETGGKDGARCLTCRSRWILGNWEEEQGRGSCLSGQGTRSRGGGPARIRWSSLLTCQPNMEGVCREAVNSQRGDDPSNLHLLWKCTKVLGGCTQMASGQKRVWVPDILQNCSDTWSHRQARPRVSRVSAPSTGSSNGGSRIRTT